MSITQAQRAQEVSIADFLLANHELVGYQQLRPMSTRYLSLSQLEALFKARRTIKMDCTESTTLICRLSGLRDPSGLNYNGYGNTGTMLGYLSHFTNPDEIHPGTIVIFDGPTLARQHAALALSNGPNPWLFSLGGSNGPIRILLSDLRQGFPGIPVVFLAVAKL